MTTSANAGPYKSQAEADAAIEHYNKNRCACGGTPLFVHPDDRTIYHLSTCNAINDYKREHGEHPWETAAKGSK